MIEVTADIQLNDDEIVERFVRASGPGGQHVNTSSTAVELRLDAQELTVPARGGERPGWRASPGRG